MVLLELTLFGTCLRDYLQQRATADSRAAADGMFEQWFNEELCATPYVPVASATMASDTEDGNTAESQLSRRSNLLPLSKV